MLECSAQLEVVTYADEELIKMRMYKPGFPGSPSVFYLDAATAKTLIDKLSNAIGATND